LTALWWFPGTKTRRDGRGASPLPHHPIESCFPLFPYARRCRFAQIRIASMAFDLNCRGCGTTIQFAVFACLCVMSSGQTPQRIRVGANVQSANLRSKVAPVYPDAAKRAGIQGCVSKSLSEQTAVWRVLKLSVVIPSWSTRPKTR
jgi:hypothetical protein